MKLTTLKKCLLCKTGELKYVFSKKSYKFVKCQKCKLLFVNPRPSTELLKIIYSKEYFEGKIDLQDQEPKNFIDEKYSSIARADKILDKVRRYKNLGNLLDIGCGLGFLLDRAIEKNWKTIGIDISDYAIKECKKRRLSVKKGSIEEVNLPNNYFDVIIATDVLEHIFDPIIFIKKVHKLLKIGGVLVIEVPNYEAAKAKIMGGKWPQYIPPIHLNFFTQTNIKSLLEKNCFNVVEGYSEVSLSLGVRNLLRKISKKNKFSLIENIIISLDYFITQFKKKYFYPPINFLFTKLNIKGELLAIIAIKKY